MSARLDLDSEEPTRELTMLGNANQKINTIVKLVWLRNQKIITA
jgi:hypothetical protein